jgi:hypothetical protein
MNAGWQQMLQEKKFRWKTFLFGGDGRIGGERREQAEADPLREDNQRGKGSCDEAAGTGHPGETNNRKDETQIPFGDDNQRGKGKGNGRDETQIPFGDDNQRGKGNDND